MDQFTLWQHLRFQCFCEAFLGDAGTPESDSHLGEKRFNRDTIEYSFFDKNYETIKDVVEAQRWSYVCLGDAGGLCIAVAREASQIGDASEDPSATLGRYEAVPAEEIAAAFSASLQALPRVFLETEKFSDTLTNVFNTVFGVCQARVGAVEQMLRDEAAQLAEGDDDEANADKESGAKHALASTGATSATVTSVLENYKAGASTTIVRIERASDTGAVAVTVAAPLLQSATEAEATDETSASEFRAAFYDTLVAVTTGAFAAFTAQPDVNVSRRNSLVILAATIGELRRKSLVGSARFPTSLLEQAALALAGTAEAAEFVAVRAKVECHRAPDAEVAVFRPPPTYVRELDTLLLAVLRDNVSASA
jgi:hypothetical protein